MVGPSLQQIAQRTYNASWLPNPYENLRASLHDPQAVDQLTAMPKLPLTEDDVQSIATAFNAGERIIERDRRAIPKCAGANDRETAFAVTPLNSQTYGYRANVAPLSSKEAACSGNLSSH
jgi:hypothetical protein